MGKNKDDAEDSSKTSVAAGLFKGLSKDLPADSAVTPIDEVKEVKHNPLVVLKLEAEWLQQQKDY